MNIGELKKKYFYNKINIEKKLLYLANGFDKYIVDKNQIKVISFENKKNQMIVVGKIVVSAKKHELLLRVISKIKLKTWKIYFLGSIENNFKKTIENFYNIVDVKSVVFVG